MKLRKRLKKLEHQLLVEDMDGARLHSECSLLMLEHWTKENDYLDVYISPFRAGNPLSAGFFCMYSPVIL